MPKLNLQLSTDWVRYLNAIKLTKKLLAIEFSGMFDKFDFLVVNIWLPNSVHELRLITESLINYYSGSSLSELKGSKISTNLRASSIKGRECGWEKGRERAFLQARFSHNQIRFVEAQ